MSKSLLETQKNKLDRLEKCLAEIWDALSPELKQRKHVFEKFLNIQTRVRKVNLKIERDLINETSQRKV